MTAWDLDVELERLRAADLYRRPRPLTACGAIAEVEGRRLKVFCSNDYLGLAQDSRVAAALQSAAEHGLGSGASHLVTGHRAAHEALEAELAQWVGRERALLFSTGYMANIGAVQALVGRGDAVFSDELNHASLIDAARLSRAAVIRYRHNDPEHLAHALASVQARRKLIITDAVFSMDGDVAPLGELAELAGRHDAWLMVDDAHGVGVLGADGAGALAALGLDQAAVPVLVGTLGKALGAYGAFVAGSSTLVDYLVQRARSYIYTTAPPPALASATVAALAIARAEGWRRERLTALIERFRRGAALRSLPLMPSSTPIQPLLVGAPGLALELSRALEEAGFLVTAIRPPTVPAGSARLRVTLSAAHEAADVEELLEALQRVWHGRQTAIGGGGVT